ncbi:hypothetical protein BDC45DRAFT_531572 [Circinella umbellata]|nr:hypothetical protein BDC45DRAFT_531572 [Circinella umbellata]
MPPSHLYIANFVPFFSAYIVPFKYTLALGSSTCRNKKLVKTAWLKFNSRLDDESDHSNDVHDITSNQRAQSFSVSTYVLIDDDSVIDAITLLQDDNIRLNATKENIDNNSRNINDLYKLFIILENLVKEENLMVAINEVKEAA